MFEQIGRKFRKKFARQLFIEIEQISNFLSTTILMALGERFILAGIDPGAITFENINQNHRDLRQKFLDISGCHDGGEHLIDNRSMLDLLIGLFLKLLSFGNILSNIENADLAAARIRDQTS